MKKILFLCVVLFAFTCMAAKPDPVREEMQAIDKQLAEYNKARDDKGAVAYIEGKLKAKGLNQAVMDHLYRRKISYLREPKDLLETLGRAVAKCSENERFGFYKSAQSRCYYLYRQRNETSALVFEKSKKDPKITPAQRFELLVNYLEHYTPQSCKEAYDACQELEKWTPDDSVGVPDYVIVNYMKVYVSRTLLATEHWLQSPTPAGYEKAVKIIDKFFASHTMKNANARIDLLTTKCECLRALKRFDEANALVKQCLAELPPKEDRRQGALVAIQAGCALDQGKWQEAYDLYGSIKEERQRKSFSVERAQAAMAMGKYQDACVLLEAYIKANGSRASRMYGGDLENLKRLTATPQHP